MSELIVSPHEQARNFSVVHGVSSQISAFAKHQRRRSVERAIRNFEHDFTVNLPDGDLLYHDLFSPDTCSARSAEAYESSVSKIGSIVIDSATRRWVALQSSDNSPLDVVSLVAPKYADDYGIFGVRPDGREAEHELPIYFMLSPEGDLLNEGAANINQAVALELRLAAEAIIKVYGSEKVDLILSGNQTAQQLVGPGRLNAVPDLQREAPPKNSMTITPNQTYL
jgi:hypothetical protein